MSGPATVAFKRALRDAVAPALRLQGLTGSGQTFVLPHESYWAQVGFQRSMASSADAVKFTINLKVTSKAWWDEQRRDHSPMKDTPPSGVDRADWDARRLAGSSYPNRPSANTASDGRTTRLGWLIPSVQRDHWWYLTAIDADEIMSDALHVLLLYGVPWLRHEIQPPVRAPD